MNWLISANGKIYDHAFAFQKWGFVDWKQRVNYNIGDIVYIYCTKPYMKVMYKTKVIKVNLTENEIVDDREFWKIESEYEKGLSFNKYARLMLVNQCDSEYLNLKHLQKNGLNGIPQGPRKISYTLASYIDKYLNDYFENNYFPESSLPDKYHEGSTCQVTVNKYERSSIARQKCIEYKGSTCYICGLNFEEKYGEIGKGFIHIHHIIPLNQIKEDYVINYKTDLIPVCPNCHAMLHRKCNNKTITVDELKILVNKLK